ncbi:hypothetical protein SCHPADRAFT_889544 [Schizopora paradoxa]|uniref:Uncharacterized protein n=1 Tax=Schizopora paradoxa TaxID=27342 RepID=A0A0H2RQD2_9AGAM|nr:hypothetical protein SCHPADRAFT_889544 [Schizopora paradoxa]
MTNTLRRMNAFQVRRLRILRRIRAHVQDFEYALFHTRARGFSQREDEDVITGSLTRLRHPYERKAKNYRILDAYPKDFLVGLEAATKGHAFMVVSFEYFEIELGRERLLKFFCFVAMSKPMFAIAIVVTGDSFGRRTEINLNVFKELIDCHSSFKRTSPRSNNRQPNRQTIRACAYGNKGPRESGIQMRADHWHWPGENIRMPATKPTEQPPERRIGNQTRGSLRCCPDTSLGLAFSESRTKITKGFLPSGLPSLTARLTHWRVLRRESGLTAQYLVDLIGLQVADLSVNEGTGVQRRFNHIRHWRLNGGRGNRVVRGRRRTLNFASIIRIEEEDSKQEAPGNQDHD